MTQDLMNEPSTQSRPEQSTGSMGSAEGDASHVDLSTIKDSALERLVAEREILTEGLRAFTGDLRNMQNSSQQQSGFAASLVSQAADRAEQLADYVEQREPQQLLGEARSFAQSHPGMFLVGAALAGGILGRATRSATEAVTSTATTPTGRSAASSQSTQEPHGFAPTPTAVDLR